MSGVILLFDLLKELSEVTLTNNSIPNVHCAIFEDNKGCIDLVKTYKLRPRTKYIALNIIILDRM